MFQHFILTRFNLSLWPHDKLGRENGTLEWLAHRCGIFEKYCLPSVAAQTCKDFEWILLLTTETPQEYKDKVEAYRSVCPQITPVYVKPEHNRQFAGVFASVVRRKAAAERIITTYLDNDDCLARNFVEDVQARMTALPDGTFLYYRHGYQYYSEYSLMLKVPYRRNHFPSVVEARDGLRTIFGYGSHYYVDKIPGAHIEMVEDIPMWCEVVHERNESNDAFFLLGIRTVGEQDAMRGLFAVDVPVDGRFWGNVVPNFIPRYARAFVRRVGYKIFGRDWWK